MRSEKILHHPDSTSKGRADQKNARKEAKLRINKLVIENGRADVNVAALGSKPQSITLKRIEMTDIDGQAGATPEQVAKQVLNASVAEVSREVAETGAKQLLDKGLHRALEQIQR